jgi:hypothetical protein
VLPVPQTRSESLHVNSYIAYFPFLLLLKIILFPSGDHDGCMSSAGSRVKRRIPEPIRVHQIISELPSAVLTNAIRLPSGE